MKIFSFGKNFAEFGSILCTLAYPPCTATYNFYFSVMLYDNGKKVLKLNTSQLIIELHEKIFRSSLFILDRSD